MCVLLLLLVRGEGGGEGEGGVDFVLDTCIHHPAAARKIIEDGADYGIIAEVTWKSST